MSRPGEIFDSPFMELAVSLARRSLPSPNPRVGAVLVKNNQIVGRGFHKAPGMPHAEIVAISDAQAAAEGADLYVTLEPCIHTGRTGPCAVAIRQAGIKRVFVGLTDPDSRVNGAGIEYLSRAGIEVVVGVDEGPCRRLLEGYITHRTEGRPRFTLKAAITLDGYLASLTADSKWISSEGSRRVAHELRAENDAVLIGIDTALADDPMLTVRHATGPSPLRIVLDTNLRLPLSSKLIQTARKTPLLLVHGDVPVERAAPLGSVKGVQLLRTETTQSKRIDIQRLAKTLGRRGVLSVLVEGGSRVWSAFLEANLVDELILFIAPKILGSGVPFTRYPNARTITEGLQLAIEEVVRIEDDLFYRARIRNQGSREKS